MTDLVVTHKFSLKSNMDKVKASIAKTIAKYDVVVTEDRLPEAKDLMATFNKDKKAFTDKCKEFLSVISAPIDEFKTAQKEIEKMFDDGRAKIADQVAKFEAKKLEAIKELIETHRDLQCEERGIDAQSVTVADLVKLTAVNVNKNGYTVAKATADVIEQRIQAVENQILKAKLEAEEKAKRDREIAEKARQEAEESARKREAELMAKQALELERVQHEAREKAEREKAEAVERAKREAEAKIRVEQASVEENERKAPQMQKEVQGIVRDTPKQENAPQPTEDGKILYNIAFTFEIKTNAKAPLDKVIEAVKNMMLNDTGKEKLKSVEVR